MRWRIPIGKIRYREVRQSMTSLKHKKDGLNSQT
jgi:hypothetical protein